MDVRFVRERSGLSQAQLAERLGVSRSLVAKWEAGSAEPDRAQCGGLAALLPGMARASALWPDRGRADSYPGAPAGGKRGSREALARRVWMARRNASIAGFDPDLAEARAREDFARDRPELVRAVKDG